MRVNVYVDAFNLYYGSLKATQYRWLDLEAMAQRLFPADDIHRIRYFTAHVKGRPDDPQQPQRQQMYLRAIATLPCVTVHLGMYRSHPTRMPLAKPLPNGPKTAEVIKTEEKGSDVNLSTYLLLDAFRQDFDLAAVISNDSDLTEPLRVVEDELGLKVCVVNPHPAARRCRTMRASMFRQLREPTLASCQFPSQMQDATGIFHKPASW